MLPIITNTTDNPATTSDDAANRPATSVYPCVPFSVDVRGPGFLTGDVTWSILDDTDTPVTGLITSGQNTIQATITFDDSNATGEYTIKACLTSNMTDCSTFSVTLLALPGIMVETPNQPHVGGKTQFSTDYVGSVTWSPAEVDSSGLATWTSAGTKTVTYTSGTCTQTLSYQVYSDVAVAQYTSGDCLTLSSGDTLQLTTTGGSGTYNYSISGQNSISSTGLIQAGLYAGEYTVTIVDPNAGVIKNIPICIGSQTQFCVAVEQKDCAVELTDSCCEISVDSGETVSLKVPTFHLRVNGKQEEIRYSSISSGTTGDAAYFKSGSGISDAAGNVINCSDDENLFKIVTSLDMSDVANSPFGVGFSKTGSGSGVNSIESAVVWFTSSSIRYVEVRKSGVAEAGTKFAIHQGDVVSGGYKNGVFVLYINNLLKATVEDITCVGSQFLDISIEQANKSLGGNLSGLTWNIVTAGLPSDVGSINENGTYIAPSSGSGGLVQAEATVGSATFRVNIRNIKPTPRFTSPNAFIAGKIATLWVGPYIPNFNENIRLAKDGSPDALQNTYQGIQMIDLGTLEGSANFQLTRDFQDFENDLGYVYYTSITKESATLAATFLEVRDLRKLALLLPDSNLYSKKNGATEMSVGGNSCSIKELRVIMVIGNPTCDTQFDVIYLPRVQNKGNFGLDIGKKTNGKFEMTLTALPDYTRPTGKQLFSLYQIDSCTAGSCSV